MTKVEEIERLWSTLAPAEKAQVLRNALREWSEAFPGITSTPGVSGGDACIVRTRIPVWLLEQLRRQGASDAEILSAYPQIHAEDLANAWAYVRAHRSEIERQFAEHEKSDYSSSFESPRAKMLAT